MRKTDLSLAGPPYPQVSHLQIELTADSKYLNKKIPKSKTRTCYMPVAIGIAFTLHRLL